MRTVVLIFFLIIIAGASILLFVHSDSTEVPFESRYMGSTAFPESPSAAFYIHNGREMKLEEGVYVDETERLQVVGEPIYGDMDGDTDLDAVILIERGDGSEYFIALAVKEGEGFLGMNTVLLGNTEVPDRMYIRDEILQVHTRDASGASTEEATRYFMFTGITFAEGIFPDQLYTGEYSFEGGTMTLRLCNEAERFSVSPHSQSFATLKAIYKERTFGTEKEEVYGVFTGNSLDAFGEPDGIRMFEITSIVRIPADGSCVAGAEFLQEGNAEGSTTEEFFDESILKSE